MARIMTPATVGVTQGALFSAMRSDMSITAHGLKFAVGEHGTSLAKPVRGPEGARGTREEGAGWKPVESCELVFHG